ncbi:MAG: hypothetical protein V1848_02650 [Candidatus Magasanikbacteria bacterium]
MNNQEELNKEVYEIASLLHNEWRRTHYDEATKSYIPRIKETTDGEWITKNGGKNEVDIANLEFNDLPRDWKKENLIAAEHAFSLLKNALVLVHDRWLEQNETNAVEEQKFRYAKLSKEEREKDILVLEDALKVIKKHLS